MNTVLTVLAVWIFGSVFVFVVLPWMLLHRREAKRLRVAIPPDRTAIRGVREFVEG